MNRHKVFVSFHHANDQIWKDRFEAIFHDYAEVIVTRSVQDGDIDPNIHPETARRMIRDEYLRDATVTVVLVGHETWKRRFVDWEISSTLRDTEFNPRGGLLGILLPTFPLNPDRSYNPRIIPPRLHDNVASGYARLYSWTENPASLQQWIHEAFVRRNENPPPVNSRELFRYNRTTDSWS
ncbi:TIR domain-containing protein [Corallococcus exercitus]|uniref:TIR domain-containing protein n=1 Tax=Corallococcus exercitus TaxID=2316736 RepID=A0A7Y4NC54_9BACT|nr:TIR domain-containing protein [Corallococcus exercitus]NOK08963.1 TIR domain-containing protein [Corallococcus exercitus]